MADSLHRKAINCMVPLVRLGSEVGNKHIVCLCLESTAAIITRHIKPYLLALSSVLSYCLTFIMALELISDLTHADIHKGLSMPVLMIFK